MYHSKFTNLTAKQTSLHGFTSSPQPLSLTWHKQSIMKQISSRISTSFHSGAVHHSNCQHTRFCFLTVLHCQHLGCMWDLPELGCFFLCVLRPVEELDAICTYWAPAGTAHAFMLLMGRPWLTWPFTCSCQFPNCVVLILGWSSAHWKDFT